MSSWKIVCSFAVSVLCLGACKEREAQPKRAAIYCRLPLGKEIHLEPLHGIIFFGHGSRVALSACPNVNLHLAFLDGADDGSYRRLAQKSAKQEDPLGYNAVAEGWIVQEGPDEYDFLALGLSDLREDPSVAAYSRHLRERSRAVG